MSRLFSVDVRVAHCNEQTGGVKIGVCQELPRPPSLARLAVEHQIEVKTGYTALNAASLA